MPLFERHVAHRKHMSCCFILFCRCGFSSAQHWLAQAGICLLSSEFIQQPALCNTFMLALAQHPFRSASMEWDLCVWFPFFCRA